MTNDQSKMIDLTGRIALVTGASRGIGCATALRLAKAGADVIINYVTSATAAAEVAEQAAEFGVRTATVKADVSEAEDITSMFEFVVASSDSSTFSLATPPREAFEVCWKLPPNISNRR